jgi:tetratricopeptide (TPR) repeat protein
MMNIPSVLKLIVAVFFLSILPVLGYALTPDQVFDKVKDSIVVVKTLDAQGKVKGQGSGVLLPSGKIATNCHVVEGGDSYQVGRGKELVRATLYAEDADKDICLLDAKGITGKPAQLGEAASLKVGVRVYAVGAPQGLELSLSDGIVAQLRGGPPPLIQTTAAISPGSSGGGLFDGEGRLVGLTTLYVEGGQSLNFAIPVEWIGKVKSGRKPVAEGRRLVGIEEKRGKISQAAADTKTIVNQTMVFWNDKDKYPNGLVTGDAATGLYDAGYVASIIDPFSTAAWPANIYRYTLNGRPFAGQTTADTADDIRAWSVGPDGVSGTADDVGYSNQIRAFGPGRKPAAAEDSQTEWEKRAIALGKMKDWRGLLDWCLKWTKSEPENALAWENLGIAYNNLKRYNDATEAYRQAIRINPEFSDFWSTLGYAYSKLKRFNDAVDAYRQAVRLNPEDAYNWYGLGYTYNDLKRYNDAIEAFRQAIRIYPENADNWYGLGYSYNNLKRYNDAIEAFRQAIRIYPENADNWYGLGYSYNNLKRYNDAIEAFRQAIRIYPENADAWYYLGTVYFLSDNRAAALDAVQKLRRLDPEKADRLFNLIVPR